MRILQVLVALAILLAPLSADARGRRHRPARVHGHGVHVVVSPWSAAYVPAARAGWVWVPGYYAGARYFPGYWRPAVARLGWAWVAGYWAGSVYVDGYWREESRPGQVWIDGTYSESGEWIPGYWAPATSADAARERGEYDQPPVVVPDAPPPEPPSGTVHHEYE